MAFCSEGVSSAAIQDEQENGADLRVASRILFSKHQPFCRQLPFRVYRHVPEHGTFRCIRKGTKNGRFRGPLPNKAERSQPVCSREAARKNVYILFM